jgi:biopolymer transport protein ExbD
MRVNGAKQVHYDSGPNLTPLVDVVVVVLIFLMLTGGFATTEHAVALARPGAARDRPLAPAGPRLDLYVDPPADPAGGDFRARLPGGDDATDADSLAARLGDFRRAFAAGGTAPDAVQVLIHPGPGVRWGPVAQACDAAREAGFPRVTLVRVTEARPPALRSRHRDH